MGSEMCIRDSPGSGAGPSRRSGGVARGLQRASLVEFDSGAARGRSLRCLLGEPHSSGTDMVALVLASVACAHRLRLCAGFDSHGWHLDDLDPRLGSPRRRSRSPARRPGLTAVGRSPGQRTSRRRRPPPSGVLAMARRSTSSFCDSAGARTGVGLGLSTPPPGGVRRPARSGRRRRRDDCRVAALSARPGDRQPSAVLSAARRRRS